MIMLLTDRSELRKQLSAALHNIGHEVATPQHRQDMLTELKNSRPELIVLDLYVTDPSGTRDLKILRDGGYQGRIIVLSGPSMMSVLKDAYAIGVDSIVQVPTKINGQFDLGDLCSTINMYTSAGLRHQR